MPDNTQTKTAAVKTGVRKTRAQSPKVRRRPPQKPAVIPENDPVLQFLMARFQEGENVSSEEQAEAEAQFQNFARSLNANRRSKKG